MAVKSIKSVKSTEAHARVAAAQIYEHRFDPYVEPDQIIAPAFDDYSLAFLEQAISRSLREDISMKRFSRRAHRQLRARCSE